MIELLLGLEDVIAKTEKVAEDTASYLTHLTNGTIDQYYSQVLLQLAVDLMAIPVDREIKKLPPIENATEVALAVEQISQIVSRTFGRSISAVQHDINDCVSRLPMHDVRAARKAKFEGRLN